MAGIPLFFNEYPSDNFTSNDSIIGDSVAAAINIKDLISYYLMGIATTSICCVGIVGNILSLIVLSKPNLRTGTTHMYLIALAVSDSLVLIFTILTALKDTRSPQLGLQGRWQLWKDVPFVAQSYPSCHALAILFQVNSVWLTVAFSADRYFVICHPFAAERFCSRCLAIIIIFFLFFLCVGYNLPRFFENELLSIQLAPNYTELAYNGTFPGDTQWPNWPNNILWYHVAPFGASKSFRQGYHFVSWMIFVVLTPFIALAVMNSFLIREVRRSYRRGRSINATERRRNDTNVMLISVIILFFICQVPAAINHVMWGFLMDSTQDIPRFLINEIGNFLVILNSAINIIPYYLFGRKFRQEFIGLFCPCKAVGAARLHLSLNSMDSHAVNIQRTGGQSFMTSVDGKRLLKTGRRSKDSQVCGRNGGGYWDSSDGLSKVPKSRGRNGDTIQMRNLQVKDERDKSGNPIDSSLSIDLPDVAACTSQNS